MPDTAQHFRDYKFKPVRSAAILTTDYEAGTVIDTEFKFKNVTLEIDFTKGSSDGFELKIEYSSDGVTYRQQQAESTSGGVTTVENNAYDLDETGAKVITIQPYNRYVRVSVKATTTGTGTSCAINAVLTNH